MMRFAAEASRHMAHAEIVEAHNPARSTRRRAPRRRTAELMEGEVPIHSIRLTGVVADQQ
jgi:4-hydroxy-tetrahydrodipicolinate reductase